MELAVGREEIPEVQKHPVGLEGERVLQTTLHSMVKRL